MNLREEVLREHSKRQCMQIVNYISSSQEQFDKLFNLFMHEESVVMQRAGWPALNLVRLNPFLIDKHFQPLIDFLKQGGLHQGCRRNAFGILDAAKIPEEKHGETLDLCIRCFESHDESIAAKSSILSILTKLARVYPEIIDEIRLLIQFQPQPLPPALKSRVKHFEKMYAK